RRTERVNDRGRKFGRGRNQSVVYCTCLMVWYKTCTQLQSWGRKAERVNDRGRKFGRGRNQSVVYCTCLIVWYKTCTQLQLWARKAERVKRPCPKICPWPQPEPSALLP